MYDFFPSQLLRALATAGRFGLTVKLMGSSSKKVQPLLVMDRPGGC